MRPRSALPFALLALSAASCGSPTSPIAQESNPIDYSLPTVDERPDDIESVGPLSIDDALLVGEDAPAPWDMQHRELDRFAYDIGANQTDCEPYWEYENLSGLTGGETMWWRDGGNLNQLVRRESEPGEAARLMTVFEELPSTCGVTSWSEGDSFTITRLSLDGVEGVADVVALSIDHVRTDEVLWLAFAQHGDLLSELRVAMWPEFETDAIPEFSVSDFGAVAATMAARLDAAGPGALTPTSTTAPPTVPGQAPPEYSVPTTSTLPSSLPDIDIPQIEPPLPPNTPAPSTTEPKPLVGLAAALLNASEMPTGWTAERATEYEATTDEEPLDGCPESVVVLELDGHFEFSTDLAQTNTDSWTWGSQFVGQLPADVDAIGLMDSLAALDGCSGTDGGGSFTFTTERIDVDGANDALVIGIAQGASTSPDEPDGPAGLNYVLALATVGQVVTAFSLPQDAPYDEFLQRAVTKIVDTGPY